VSERDHTQGRSDAPVSLVEFGDYECPFCGRAYWVVKEVREAMGDQLRYVFRNFPLTQIHPRAELAAEAAEAAGAQGKFWEMHDLIYENQDALDLESLASFAAGLGLDTERFLSDLNLRSHAGRVAEDRNSALRSGVNGTPTFFINGIRHDGPTDFESLLNALQAEARGRTREAG
jgi:protein-disulfide isomerase